MIVLTKGFLDKVILHSRKEFPNEACGILAGKDGKIEKVYEMANIDKSPNTFFMDAKEQFKVMKEIRNLTLGIIGIYHSHVAGAAYPSAHDVEMAFYPQASYVIVSLMEENKPSVRSFRIKEGRIDEEEVRVV